jgi:hypothetical protein
VPAGDDVHLASRVPLVEDHLAGDIGLVREARGQELKVVVGETFEHRDGS